MDAGTILIPFFIFTARVIDVSIGTIRIVFISRGLRRLPALLGFVEVLIWLTAITQIMRNMHNPINYIAFAAGFGMGNFVGITIERRLSVGNVTIRVITKKDASSLIGFLKDNGYGVTTVEAEGASGPVQVIFTVTRRKAVTEVVDSIKRFNPNAFYTIEDIRFATEQNIFPLDAGENILHKFNNLFLKKK
ncbi:MAG: DUF2179 domain-containing protein [Candidatus Omnitrophota bacterium]